MPPRGDHAAPSASPPPGRGTVLPPARLVGLTAFALLAVPLPAAGQRAAVDTDTYAVGHASFARYDTPGLCRAAVLTERDVLRRSVEAQVARGLAPGDPARDTLPAGAVTVARVCGARFTAVGVAAVDLPDLFDLAVLGNNDTLAAAVVRRRVALAASDSARRRVWRETVAGYLAASPPRTEVAESVAAAIGAPGPAARWAQLDAYAVLLRHHELRNDTERATQTAERMLALGRELTRAELTAGAFDQLRAAYGALMTRAWLDQPEAMAGVAERARADLRRVAGVPASDDPHQMWAIISGWASLDTPALVEHLSPVKQPARGEPVPRLEADAWFPAGAAQTYARPGRVSLVLRLDDCAGSEWGAFEPYRLGCAAEWGHIRRWHAQYGASGLDITVVVPTTGHPLFTVAPTFDDEARTLDWYYREYQQLPVSLVVLKSPLTQFPAPDGRQFRANTYPDSGSVYATRSLTPLAVLAGRDGRLLYVGESRDWRTGESPALLDAVLRRTLTAPSHSDTSRNRP